MRAQYFAAAALFATSAVATSTWTRITSPVDDFHALRVRQVGGFEPEGRKGSGDTCKDAFGDGYVQCGNSKHCFNPNLGQSCCDGCTSPLTTTYHVCPSGSGCLTNGRCCSDSEGPKACLEQLTKTNLPTKTPPATPTEYPTETPSESPTEPTEYPTPTVSPTESPTVSPTEPPTEYPTPTETPTEYPTETPTDDHCDAPTDYPTGTDAPPYPTLPPSEPTYPVHPTGGSPNLPTETPPYEGGANSLKVATGAVAVLGFISFIQNAL